MALSARAVETAWKILNEIDPLADNSFPREFDEDQEEREHLIFGCDRKSDGGWENVFLNVKNISPDQLAIFERRKKEIGNTSFKRAIGNGITRIGWF